VWNDFQTENNEDLASWGAFKTQAETEWDVMKGSKDRVLGDLSHLSRDSVEEKAKILSDKYNASWMKNKPRSRRAHSHNMKFYEFH